MSPKKSKARDRSPSPPPRDGDTVRVSRALSFLMCVAERALASTQDSEMCDESKKTVRVPLFRGALYSLARAGKFLTGAAFS